MLPNRKASPLKFSKKRVLILAGIAVALGIAGILLPLLLFSRARITRSLQETFPATVTFQKFHSTFLPHPGCVGEGLVFTRLGSPPGMAPVVTVQRFTIEAHYIDLLLRPGYLARVVMNGFRVHVPRMGTEIEKTNWHETRSTRQVGEMIADGAVIEIDRVDPAAPLLFEVQNLKLASVSEDKPIAYAVSFHNPLPPGEIRAQGQFGPWDRRDPGQTLVSGHSFFQNADLGAFDGVAGMFSSEDKFQGILSHIETEGTIDIPDFVVVRTRHAVHLTAVFHALVDGTNGDVELDDVRASFLKTRVLAKAKIAGQSGQTGKTASVDLNVHEGRMQDVLWLFVRRPKPPFNGMADFRAHVVIPPGDRRFLEKMQISADFGIAHGQFTRTSTQKDIDALSGKALGAKQDKKAEQDDPERVVSNLAGHVELRNATATFGHLSFDVPGAFAEMHGTFNLESEAVDLHGTLKTSVELSKMSSGFKSALLKPFDIFFKRNHAGAAVPVHLIGTYNDPQPGLDLPTKKSSTKPSAAPASN